MKTVLRKLLEWVRPAQMRVDPERGTDRRLEANDQVLGRMADNDPLYLALTDHAYGQAMNAVLNATQPKLEDRERAFLCGVANGLLSYLQVVEETRGRARQELERRAKQPK